MVNTQVFTKTCVNVTNFDSKLDHQKLFEKNVEQTSEQGAKVFGHTSVDRNVLSNDSVCYTEKQITKHIKEPILVPIEINTNSDNDACSDKGERQNADGLVTETIYSNCPQVQIPVFDINRNWTDDKFELGLIVKEGWKKHIQWLETHCSDFKLWNSQSDFHFGFVPFAELHVE